MVKRPTLAQVMISQLVGSSPSLSSVLTTQSLEPASDSVSVSLCPSPAHVLSVLLSQNINVKKIFLSLNTIKPLSYVPVL